MWRISTGRDSKRDSTGSGVGSRLLRGVEESREPVRERLVGRRGIGEWEQRGPLDGEVDGRSRSLMPTIRDLLFFPGFMKPMATTGGRGLL